MFLERLMRKAKQHRTRIVFTESQDVRVRRAVARLHRECIVEPVLLRHPKGKPVKGVPFIDPQELDREQYAKRMYHMRKAKGWTLKQCRKKIEDPNYLAVMMVVMGDADAFIAGATQPTADTLRPALQLLKRKTTVSGAFFMLFHDRIILFTDCAVTIDPDAKQLAQIARNGAKTMRMVDRSPRVAMLSFSTKGSAKHPLTRKVSDATKRLRNAGFIVDGELQADTALVPAVAKVKAPKARIQGDANVLVFPSLEAGNIGYKLVQRLAQVQAVGPIMEGLRKPVNDLSRGCSVDDIIHVAALTALQVHR